MSEDSDVTSSMNAMAAKIGELVIEIRHSNERFDESQKRTDKAIDIMRAEHKDTRKDVNEILQRLPLIESTNGSVRTITNRVVGGIIMAAVIGGLTVGFMLPKAKAETIPVVQQTERLVK